ncbi:uncharacterized protein N7496_000855 [Penicillium cataractarum]|uniref:Uncharacterized protein n=1 Tax=Penicillium cataractarum TaxID=2100454 RepID=A0A9W9VUV5_9EURO|nr:uncharacterized protein N7496_000855 [Penicillium cataractarum]KAJ5389787.1 hypothetical protein N7496_000855 [Penicillium cataractarum]
MSPHTITMGLTESKLVIDVLSEAYNEAKRSGNSNVEVKLSNAKFIKSVQQLWAYIATESTDGTQGVEDQLPENDRAGESSKTARLTQSKYVVLPGIMKKVSRWKEIPLSFFDEEESHLSLAEYPLAKTYEYLRKLVKRSALDKIRKRLLRILFNRLRERLGVNRLLPRHVENIVQIISRSGVVKDCDRRTIKKWVDEGSRIDALCRDIGSITGTGYAHLRNLFYLNDISDTRMIRMHTDGKDRTKEIQQIKLNLVYNNNEALQLEELANLLMEEIWKPMEDLIPQLRSEVQQTQQIPILQVRGAYSLAQDTQIPTSFRDIQEYSLEDSDASVSSTQGAHQITCHGTSNYGDFHSGTRQSGCGDRLILDQDGNNIITGTSGFIAGFFDSLDVADVADTDCEGSLVPSIADAGLIPPLSYPGATSSELDTYWCTNMAMDDI